MSDAVYPYRIHFPRTRQWYPNHKTYGDGDWIKLSIWCNQCFASADWNYYGDTFVFSREQDYMLFKLKWL